MGDHLPRVKCAHLAPRFPTGQIRAGHDPQFTAMGAQGLHPVREVFRLQKQKALFFLSRKEREV